MVEHKKDTFLSPYTPPPCSPCFLHRPQTDKVVYSIMDKEERIKLPGGHDFSLLMVPENCLMPEHIHNNHRRLPQSPETT